MSKFTFPKRYDKNAADEGKLFPVYNEYGDFYGKYKVRMINGETVRGRKEFQDARQYFGCDREGISEVEADAASTRLFVETYLVGWEIPEEITGGEEVPFSKDVAFDMLNDEDNQWIVKHLYQVAFNITNFRPVLDKDGKPGNTEKN